MQAEAHQLRLEKNLERQLNEERAACWEENREQQRWVQAERLRMEEDLRLERETEHLRREQILCQQMQWKAEKREMQWRAEHRELEWKSELRQLKWQADLQAVEQLEDSELLQPVC